MNTIMIKIPAQLRHFTNEVTEEELTAVNVGEALLLLCQKYPDLSSHLVDENKDLPSFVNLFIDDVNIKELEGLNTLLQEDNVLNIEMPIAF
ncbi:MAG: MoaD/ThiS family protein [Pseudomonadales bacterium]|nr:MoaD/ThiS family protein [Pseudomonadales bacterium]NRA16633.1 MoaD/ThiS family protein [Oceanospirillaceae bacterium]